jgi:hypothetical protein
LCPDGPAAADCYGSILAGLPDFRQFVDAPIISRLADNPVNIVDGRPGAM